MNINEIIEKIEKVMEAIRRLMDNPTVRRILRFVLVIAVIALWTAGTDLFAATSSGLLMAGAGGVTLGDDTDDSSTSTPATTPAKARAGAMFDQPLTLGLTRGSSPSLLRSEVDERVVKIRPSATPVDQISRLGGARHSNSVEVDYYSVDTKPGEDVLVAGSTKTAWKVKTPDYFAVSDTVMLPSVKDKNGEALIGYVESVGESSITVKLVQETDDDLTLPAGSKVVRMGRAAKELDVQTPLFNSVPTKETNYCQIFKAQVEQSRLQRLADKEVGWTFSDQEEVAIMDMRMGMEKSFLFGRKARISGAGGDDVWLTGGIWNQTDNDYHYTTFDLSALQGLMKQAFTGNAGSSRKVLVGGTGLIDKINRLAVSRVVMGTDKETVWGVDFHKLVSKFGTLYVVHSEVFDACGGEDRGMVIDPEYLTKYTHIPFSAERLSLRQSGVRNTEAVVITEASCLVLRYPKAHVRIIKD